MKNNLIRRVIIAVFLSLLVLVIAFGQNDKLGFVPYQMFKIAPGGLRASTVYKFQDYENTCYVATGQFSSGIPVAISCLKNK